MRRTVFAAACLILIVVADVIAQGAPQVGEDIHSVSGRVLRPDPSGLAPVAGIWVVLHRLGSDRAGPLDSMRTDRRGGYSFRYVPTGDERALYFAAASYGGVAYFTPPLVDHAVAGEAAEIVVYDTTTRNIPISIRGRHFVVSGATTGDRREVMEIYELSNDTTVTRVSPHAGAPPTWSTMLPASAGDMRVAAGDVPAEAVHFEGGEARLVAPIPPGVRQLGISYTLPMSAFPLAVPVTTDTELLEVLIEDPAGTARGAQLAEATPVTVEGRNFRRFLAQDVRQGSVGIIDIPGSADGSSRRYIFAIVLLMGAVMVFALARTFRRA